MAPISRPAPLITPAWPDLRLPDLRLPDLRLPDLQLPWSAVALSKPSLPLTASALYPPTGRPPTQPLPCVGSCCGSCATRSRACHRRSTRSRSWSMTTAGADRLGHRAATGAGAVGVERASPKTPLETRVFPRPLGRHSRIGGGERALAASHRPRSCAPPSLPTGSGAACRWKCGCAP